MAIPTNLSVRSTLREYGKINLKREEDYEEELQNPVIVVGGRGNPRTEPEDFTSIERRIERAA